MTAHSMGQATPLEVHRQILSELWKKLNDWCAEAADLRAGGHEAVEQHRASKFRMGQGCRQDPSHLQGCL